MAFRPTLAAFGRFVAGTLALAAPPQCRLCRTALFGHVNPFLCPACAASILWIGPGACRKCGFPAGPYADLGAGCRRCRAKGLRLTAAASVARYRGAARRLIISFKFGGETELARPLANLMAERMRRILPPADMVTPVALHPARARRRGFDQAGMLARLTAEAAGLPFRPGILAKIRDTRPQSSLGREARFENIHGAFRADGGAAGKSVILVDDVMTTGATMADCARACREAGAKHVFALVFGR